MAALLHGNPTSLLDLPCSQRRRLRLLPPDSAASTSHAFPDRINLGIRATAPAQRRRTATRASSSPDEVEEDLSGDDGSEARELELELKARLRELEDTRELEKRAAELQTQLEEETEEVKRERVRKELEKLAKEQAERRETAQLMFELGQKAYGKGMYRRAVEYLEGALTVIPRLTQLGGEVQIWLAMAYEANNRHRDCINLYAELEQWHPHINIRRQAAELRYILEAPKLKISKEEMVTIPLIGSSYDNYAGVWTKSKEEQERIKSASMGRSRSQDYWGDFLPWRSPAGWEKSRIFWVYVSLLLGLTGVALLIQN